MNYHFTTDRYNAMRAAARAAAQARLQELIDAGRLDDSGKSYIGCDIHVTPVDKSALSAWRTNWEGHADRIYDWDWIREMAGWRTTYRRTDAAIWSNGQLCGLLVGCASKGREFLRIDLLEGSPDVSHALKARVAYCAAEIGMAFGWIFACQNLIFYRPVTAAIPIYEDLGFRLATTKSNMPYCMKEI
ncbi:hypothetical protein [Sinorhizobium terangae]|uniref:hypothetical protein n=1 Tax=Sinorhizobium terangae TaxID=110322 RepID=UPI0024B18F12|nr:hypothetical protein [Sinorhizobium terangae]WFU49129.1 hypothetical protein QA637_06945 [Sinorhizobium terangae]